MIENKLMIENQLMIIKPTNKINTDKGRVRLPSQGIILNYGTEPLPMPKKRVLSKKVKKIDNQLDAITTTPIL